MFIVFLQYVVAFLVVSDFNQGITNVGLFLLWSFGIILIASLFDENVVKTPKFYVLFSLGLLGLILIFYGFIWLGCVYASTMILHLLHIYDVRRG